MSIPPLERAESSPLPDPATLISLSPHHAERDGYAVGDGHGALRLTIYSYDQPNTIPRMFNIVVNGRHLTFANNRDFELATNFPHTRYQLFDIEARSFMDIHTFMSLEVDLEWNPWLLIKESHIRNRQCVGLETYANNLFGAVGRPLFPRGMFGPTQLTPSARTRVRRRHPGQPRVVIDLTTDGSDDFIIPNPNFVHDNIDLTIEE